MIHQHTAADLLAVSEGKQTLRREPRVSDQPLGKRKQTPAVTTRPAALPYPRARQLSAKDILAISEHTQPWRALTVAAALSDAG